MASPSHRTPTSGSFSIQRIMGIDPGTVITGWGVIEAAGTALRHLAHGTINTTGAQDHGARLRRIYQGIQKAIEDHKPDGVSLEKIFFARNAQSALKLGQARGVALLAAGQYGAPIHEYAASEIKLAVVGYGQASKEQVQRMVYALLHLPEKVAVDAADALAAAICHFHQKSFESRVLERATDWGDARRRGGLS